MLNGKKVVHSLTYVKYEYVKSTETFISMISVAYSNLQHLIIQQTNDKQQTVQWVLSTKMLTKHPKFFKNFSQVTVMIKTMATLKQYNNDDKHEQCSSSNAQVMCKSRQCTTQHKNANFLASVQLIFTMIR